MFAAEHFRPGGHFPPILIARFFNAGFSGLFYFPCYRDLSGGIFGTRLTITAARLPIQNNKRENPLARPKGTKIVGM
jgi:hypothetical protein